MKRRFDMAHHNLNNQQGHQMNHVQLTSNPSSQDLFASQNDVYPYVMQTMTESDMENALGINSSPPVHNVDTSMYGTLLIKEDVDVHSSVLHGNVNNVSSSVVMCDSTHLHTTEPYQEAQNTDNMVLIPQYPPLMAPTFSEATQSYPSTNDYPGDYNFEILLDGSGSGFKAWMYSFELNKVFIDINKVLPIQVKLSYKQNEPIPPLFLRATPIYSQDDYRGRPVERCPLHLIPEENVNKGFEHMLKHIVRCTSANCQYPQDERSGRYTCVCPLTPPQPGSDVVTLMYSFVCKTSCLGGMDRRPVLVLFTLENQLGQILGRRSLGVKICACPKRDKQKEEEEFQSNGTTNRKQRGRKRTIDTRIKEEMDEHLNGGVIIDAAKKYCSDIYEILQTVPVEQKLECLNVTSTVFAGMFMKYPNQQVYRTAHETSELLIEKLKNDNFVMQNIKTEVNNTPT